MSYITRADEVRLDEKYGGLGASMAEMRPDIPAGSYMLADAQSAELLRSGTVGGAPPRGKTRAQAMSYAKCMNRIVPAVPAGTVAEQGAFAQPFATYCWQAAMTGASTAGQEPRTGWSPSGPGTGVDPTDGFTTNEMLMMGVAGVAVIAAGAYFLTR